MSAPEGPRRSCYLSKIIFIAVRVCAVFAGFGREGTPSRLDRKSARARIETEWGSRAGSGDLYRRRTGGGGAAPCGAGAHHHGHARRPERFDDGYHPSHSGFARSRGGLCESGWRARGFGGISDPAFSGYRGDGSGDANGRGHADLDAQLGDHADRRSAAKEN